MPVLSAESATSLTTDATASVRNRASADFQFVVISLKNSFWERARGLVGIWRDVDAGSSKVLTLDVRPFVLLKDDHS